MMNIPYQNMEIEQIYTQLLSNPHTSIAICSAQEGEGVTSLAFALAQRNLLAGHSTLLVDLNLYRPAIKSLLPIEQAQVLDPSRLHQSPANANYVKRNEGNNEGKHELSYQQSNTATGISTHTPANINALLTEPQLVSNANNSIVLTGVVAPKKREHIMKIRQPGVLEQCIETWLTQYDTVIIDTSPINRINAQNIPPERVAAACDGALLVVLAGRTPEAAIKNAVTKLENANAQLLGSVLNDRDNPTLKEELLREVQRLAPRFPWLSRPLKRALNKIRLLALEI